jgi:hypothetical protein
MNTYFNNKRAIRLIAPADGRRWRNMRRRYNPFLLPPWLRTVRAVTKQLIIPFTIFQAIRTLIIPTTLDVVLLFIFIFIAVALYFEWI